MKSKYKEGDIIYVPVKVDEIKHLNNGISLYKPNEEHAKRAGWYIPESIISEVDGKLFINKELLGERVWKEWGYAFRSGGHRAF